jgi:hypothetical protein
MGHINESAAPLTPGSVNPDDDIIPTAIVIKNIPFNVKRETLLDIIVSIQFSKFTTLTLPIGFIVHSDAICVQLSP